MGKEIEIESKTPAGKNTTRVTTVVVDAVGDISISAEMETKNPRYPYNVNVKEASWAQLGGDIINSNYDVSRTDDVFIRTNLRRGETSALVTSTRKVTARVEDADYEPNLWETTEKATIKTSGREEEVTLAKSPFDGKGDRQTVTVYDTKEVSPQAAAKKIRAQVEDMLDRDEAAGGTARKQLIAKGVKMPEQMREFLSGKEETFVDLPGGYGDAPRHGLASTAGTAAPAKGKGSRGE